MGFAILLSLFVLFFWFYYRNQRSRRDLAYIIFLISMLIIWVTYFFVKDYYLDDKKDLIFLSSLVAFVLLFYYLKNLLSSVPLNIIAKQESYWDISASKIVNFFAYRKDYKKKRIDININELQQSWIRQFNNNEIYLSANFFLDYENLTLTKIKNIKELSSYPLYEMIFIRLSKVINDKELKLNYDDLLLKNDFIAEYFLMELWETYTKDINIGIASLILKANRNIEKELISALDNLDLNSVKRNGAGLYYSYMKFKNKLPILQEQDLFKVNVDSKYEDF
ncbi:hypothetical protein [Helicobacter sp. MIT 14-3879]|uniref:hypothetical protein n=1 Tax=Helicobacter sp. MIT 14-3879 TaxID=2040649 RepID=UPI000E1F5A99|nr:hypothetical protein [Helicobacter sp. MIT 14-3879]RDU61868.1 hypothetical protein CQA44_08035 [Helicobacter sp. MIT 14-3879]